MRVLVGLGFIVVAAVSGCGGQIPPVTPELVTLAQQRWPAATTDSLTRGRAILTTRCGQCHRPPGPADHSENEWNYYLPIMAPRAQLSATQRDELTIFLFAARVPLPAAQ